MPMGDWDRLKHHISDYLEGNLDNSTRKEFEEEISRNDELKKVTGRVEKLSHMLTNLPEYKCSDDFNQKLRERIHNQSSSKLDNIPIKKISFAISFAVLLVIVVFSFNTFTGSDDPANNLPESSNIESNQSDPGYQNKVQPPSQVRASSRQVDVKTIQDNEAASDSLSRKNLKKIQDQDNIKQVDEVKK
jgi:hypothetical protein